MADLEAKFQSTEYERLFDYHRWWFKAQTHSLSTVILLSVEELQVLSTFIEPFSSVDVDKPELQGIQEKINAAKTPLPWFVRLTSRSPKDSGDCKANHPKDVLKLLCESERVEKDVEDYLEDKAEIGIVIQPWNPNISVADELRLFVFFGKIVAICSIDEDLKNNFEACDVTFIQDFFSAQAALWEGYEHFIIDVCFNRNTKQVTFIELNPYGPLSDAMSFDWEEDKDILFPASLPEAPVLRF